MLSNNNSFNNGKLADKYSLCLRQMASYFIQDSNSITKKQGDNLITQ